MCFPVCVGSFVCLCVCVCECVCEFARVRLSNVYYFAHAFAHLQACLRMRMRIYLIKSFQMPQTRVSPLIC